MIAAILFACQTVVFPPNVQSLRFRQTTNDAKAEMTWSERRVDGDRIRWQQSFVPEGGTMARSVSEFRCSAAGITPLSEGTKFTGVQYGNDLAAGASWTWTWAAPGIWAKYDYRVAGKERVTVPAGTFDTVRVDYTAQVVSDTRGDRPELRGTLWIAKDVGLVKQFEDDPAIGLTPEKTTLELLSRLPGSSTPSR